MSDRKVYVFIELNGINILVGNLWARYRNGKETASFEYDDEWLKNKNRFPIEPNMELFKMPYYTTDSKKIFGSFGDSAPDRWGRILMRRYEENLAKKEKRAPRRLNEIDYLLMVNDEARQGALRFKDDLDGEFLLPPEVKPIPPLVRLPELLNSALNVVDDNETDDDLRLLLAPGSSLGGARPKASVIDNDGNLSIAKFPKKDDSNNIVLWEAVALHLAKDAKINTPNWFLEKSSKKAIIVINRFDRVGKNRIPFLSAMSMLDATDNDDNEYSYMEIADILRQYGSEPSKDMKELWRRIIFSILISNTDDHLRNHGFLYDNERGWRLSPVYDVNPTNDRTGILHTNISEDSNTASIELALSVAEYFDLKEDEAISIIVEVYKAVANWEKIAKFYGIANAEINRMRIAFEHEQFEFAKNLAK